MIEEIQELVDGYLEWIRDKSVLEEVGDGWVQITTPHLDRHNDCAQIYVRKEGESYRMTDGGEVLQDLRACGCELDTDKRKGLLAITLNGFGISNNEGALEVIASAETFSLKKHNLVQAVLAVGDLFYLAQPIVTSLFIEDVSDWLDQREIRYLPKPRFHGHSGYDHTFDFAIPGSRTVPERTIKAVSRPTQDMAKALAFSWLDIKEVRPPNASLFAILNDQEGSSFSDVVEALESYEIRPVLWSERESVEEELAA